MPCALCDDTTWKTITVDGISRVTRCDCVRASASARLLGDARIPRRYQHCDFANYTAYNEQLTKALQFATRLAEAFPGDRQGAVFPGPARRRQDASGRGGAAAGDCDARRPRPLLRHARPAARDPQHLRSGESDAEMDVLRPVIEADLLVLDDLGAEKTSEWVEETLNLIVNARYSERRTTVFTSNYDDNPDNTDPDSLLFRIGFRMRSRLHEMCEFLYLDGGDYRELPPNGGVDDLHDAVEDAQQGLAQAVAASPVRRPGPRTAARRRAGRREGGLEVERGASRIAVMPLGLYIHVPFCSAICNYCTFNRGLFDHALKTEYVRGRPEGDSGRATRGARRRDTIFFGGGTPSLLEPEEIGAMVDACRRRFALAADAEVTLEANPESVTPERLAGFREAGINRLSFGVQSFSDAELQRLSRLHSASRAREAFAMARDAGFDNISLDLMMWLPQQSIAEWLTTVDALIALGPEHASLYLLEIYPNSPLRDAMAKSKWAVAPDDDAAEMYLQAMERLDAAGYEQYEISNVARGGTKVAP